MNKEARYKLPVEQRKLVEQFHSGNTDSRLGAKVRMPSRTHLVIDHNQGTICGAAVELRRQWTRDLSEVTCIDCVTQHLHLGN